MTVCGVCGTTYVGGQSVCFHSAAAEIRHWRLGFKCIKGRADEAERIGQARVATIAELRAQIAAQQEQIKRQQELIAEALGCLARAAEQLADLIAARYQHRAEVPRG